MEQLQQDENKKVEEYAKTSLIGGIFLVLIGFGFGFVNLALLLITAITGIMALVKNQNKIQKITAYSSVGLGLIVIAFILSFVLTKAPIDYIVTDILIPSIDKFFFEK